MKTLLFIDTSSSEYIRVGIKKDGSLVKITSPKETHAHGALLLIKELLEKQQLKLSDVTEIKVHTGPGSYTGLRVGIAIANTLGTLLGVPVNEFPIGQTASPVYEGDRYA